MAMSHAATRLTIMGVDCLLRATLRRYLVGRHPIHLHDSSAYDYAETLYRHARIKRPESDPKTTLWQVTVQPRRSDATGLWKNDHTAFL